MAIKHPGIRARPICARLRTFVTEYLAFILHLASSLFQLPELSQFTVGLMHIQLLHTSASLAINENWDPDVRDDMEMMLNRIIPEDVPFRHSCEGPDDMVCMWPQVSEPEVITFLYNLSLCSQQKKLPQFVTFCFPFKPFRVTSQYFVRPCFFQPCIS